MPSRCVWLDGVAESVTESHLHEQFSIYGTVNNLSIDKKRGQALVFYETVSKTTNVTGSIVKPLWK